ncbi:MAG: methyltransferase domain-containing protein [Myxococcota bacterium]
MSVNRERERQIWNRLSRRYDLLIRVLSTSYSEIRDRLGRDLRGRNRVLEIAAGTGQFTSALADVADEVVATDLAPSMVERLERRMRGEGRQNVITRVVDATAIDVDSQSFDAVFCANALHIMSEPEAALAEFHRVLVADGLLVTPTFLHGTDRIRRLLSETMGVLSPRAIVFARFDLRHLGAMVATASFDITQSERLPGVFPIGYVVARRIS